MSMVAVALGLLVADGLAAWALVVRRPAARRAGALRWSSEPAVRSERADRANADLRARQTVVRAQRSDHRSPIVPPTRERGRPSPTAPATTAEMTRDADLLAGPDALLYDAATWER